MEFKGTKGRWVLEKETFPQLVRMLDTPGMMLELYSRDDGNQPSESLANAKLIAAAPELLGALQGCHEAIKREANPSNSMLDAYFKAEEAIKKALS